MRQTVFAAGSSLLIFSVALWAGQALRTTVKAPTGEVRGHITIDEVVGTKAQSNPVPELKLYLLRVDDARPLVVLQENCRRATSDPNADPVRAYQTCDQSLRQAVNLVPTLPSVATTETDRDGQYEFAEVPATGRYKVVGVKKVEGAEPFLLVGMTNRLRAGERITLNLSANDPWTKATTP